MSGDKSNLFGCVSLGSPPKRLKEDVEKMRFKIHNFASLQKSRDESVSTPSIQAHGYSWKLQVYPRGDLTSTKAVEYVSVYLQYVEDINKEKPSVDFNIRCNNMCGNSSGIYTFKDGRVLNGFKNYLKRDDVLENYLGEDGTLVVDVDLKITVKKEDTWYPALSPPNDLLTKMYELSDETTSDVIFDVEGKEYRAHKRASFLFVRKHCTN